jgi:hypothetical protein
MEKAAATEKDKSDKETRKPEDLGALAMISERVAELSARFEKPAASGHVGAAALLAEAKPGNASETSRESKAETKAVNVETMSRAELLSLSEKAMIDGSSLRQIYETHLIGEHGLRRLVAEYLRDGDLKKALRREIIERQIDFERDPAIRDIAVYPNPLSTSTTTDNGRAALDKLLKRTDLSADTRSEEAAFFKARALYEANELLQHKQRRRVADISVAAVITILLALLLVLYMSRS